jgi:hypothetical protein
MFIADFLNETEDHFSSHFTQNVSYQMIAIPVLPVGMQKPYQYFQRFITLRCVMISISVAIYEQKVNLSDFEALKPNFHRFAFFLDTLLRSPDLDDILVANFFFKSYKYTDEPLPPFKDLIKFSRHVDSFSHHPDDQEDYIRVEFEYLTKEPPFNVMDPSVLNFLIELNRLLSAYDSDYYKSEIIHQKAEIYKLSPFLRILEPYFIIMHLFYRIHCYIQMKERNRLVANSRLIKLTLCTYFIEFIVIFK